MHEFLRIISHHLKIFFPEKTDIASCQLNSLFVAGSGNSYCNYLLHLSFYTISIIHPLFCYSLPYPKSRKKISSLMDVKTTANQVSATVTTEGMSARRIWG
jgi:hypothetical protein